MGCMKRILSEYGSELVEISRLEKSRKLVIASKVRKAINYDHLQKNEP